MPLFLGQSFGEVLGDVSAKIFPSVSAVVTQLLATLVLFIIVRKFLWGPAMDFIEKRKSFVDENLRSARELQEQAEKQFAESEEAIKKSYHEARAIVEDAKVKAMNEQDAIIAKAVNEARLKKEQADREIEQEKVRAQKEMREEIIEVALAAAQKIVERELNENDEREFVEKFVEEVGQ